MIGLPQLDSMSATMPRTKGILVNEELLDSIRTTLTAYLEGLSADGSLTLYLVSGEKLHIQGAPGQGEPSIWYDLIDVSDNAVSVRLDQIAAIREVEDAGAMPIIV